jgi:hypothetical protein
MQTSPGIEVAEFGRLSKRSYDSLPGMASPDIRSNILGDPRLFYATIGQQ